jgi:hypothetical protein
MGDADDMPDEPHRDPEQVALAAIYELMTSSSGSGSTEN